MREIWNRIDAHYDGYAKKAGLNTASIMVLDCLYRVDFPYTQKALCEKLLLPKQFVNTIVNAFREQGHVALREAKDRRNKEIRLTPSGKAYAQAVVKPLDDAEEEAWASLTDPERETLARALQKFEQSLRHALER
ncbi:MAG: MarR family transcriptional regulator [Defluviitaleaceae bacterium]|nr:MarR family transcriptional regulator [Defluviitaleaceae bacterium]MCL2238701.1 MarR family transcriptional regulator [Defluviitaleaceae bacterium]